MDYAYEPLLHRPGRPQFRLLTLLPASEQKPGQKGGDPTILLKEEKPQLDPQLLPVCRLSTYPIDGPECPKYEALSHCWTPESEDRKYGQVASFTLDDCQFSVKVNLALALARLKYPDRPRVLWIDAICINQADDQEKSDQVSLMRKIYNGATRVLVWLGMRNVRAGIDFERAGFTHALTELVKASIDDLVEDPKRVFDGVAAQSRKLVVPQFDIIQAMARRVKSRLGTGSSVPDLPVLAPSKPYDTAPRKIRLIDRVIMKSEVIKNNAFPLIDDFVKLQRAIIGIMVRKWWQRMWIVQEFCLANETLILHGELEVDMDLFYLGLILELIDNPMIRSWLRLGPSSITQIADSETIGANETSWAAGLKADERFHVEDFGAAFSNIVAFSHLVIKRHEVKLSTRRGELLETLWTFRLAEASDPRDKVFALLGLIPPSQEKILANDGLVANYVAPVEDCFKRTARALLRTSNTLDVLATPTLGEGHGELKLPSWVPDWSRSSGGINSLLRDADRLPREASAPTATTPFKACGSCLYHQVLFADDDTLVLSGFVFDRITQLARPITTTVDKALFRVLEVMSALFSTIKKGAAAFDKAIDKYMSKGEAKAETKPEAESAVEAEAEVAAEAKAEAKAEVKAEVKAYSASSSSASTATHEPIDEDDWEAHYEALFDYTKLQAMAFGASLADFLESVLEWEHLARSISPYPTGEDAVTILCTMYCNADFPDGFASRYEDYNRWSNSLWALRRFHSFLKGRGKTLSDHRRLLGLWMVKRMRTKKKVSWTAMIDYAYGRSLARTETGYLALVPGSCRLGDDILLCRGSKVPLVARREAGGWRLVGACNTHGIMQGEAWDEARCEDLKFV